MRESVSPLLTRFFMLISDMTIYVIPVVILTVYWCGDKEYGKKMASEITYSFWFNGVVKLTACIYRPWVRDSRLYVFEDAAPTATGYSFPSAHTTAATIGFSNIAEHTRKTALKVVSILLILLVMLSRLWLGCHSPADVIAGLLIGIGSMLVVRVIDSRLDGRENKSLIMLIIAVVLCGLSVLYIETKPYPMDYDALGNLIVDPEDMKQDTYLGIGMVLGWNTGNLIEDRFIRFTTEGTKLQKTIRVIIGLVVFLGVFSLRKILLAGCSGFLQKFLGMFAALLVAVVIYPWLFMKWRNRKK